MSEQEAAEGEAAGRRRKPRRDASEKQDPHTVMWGNNKNPTPWPISQRAPTKNDRFLAGELVDNPIDTKKIKDQITHLRLT